MKKLFLLTLALITMMTLKAQWTDNAANNTSIANCNGDDGEIYTSTNPNSDYTYVQWNAFGANGWSPHLQCLSFNGEPLWGKSGIHISAPSFTSWSDGYAMAATSDGGVVSAFHTADGHNCAVKINADGSFPWGEQGIVLFDGQGGDRAEVIAGNDGGVWTLGSDFAHSYLQYIHADGTMGLTTVIFDPSGANCMFGQLTLSYNNNVLLTYEKLGMGKEIYVVGVTPEGELFNDGTLLMAPLSFQSTYIHSVVPDGHGGGYAYIWHPAFDEAFNTYVFHFNALGESTIYDSIGIPVHSSDPANYYGNAYASALPVSHDLIIAYEQTDSYTQQQSRIYVNRITEKGQRVWDDGILVADDEGFTYSDIKVDAFEDGSGFTIIYTKSGNNPYFTTIESVGMDLDGNQLWTRTMCSTLYRRTLCQNSTGFHLGQNVVAWINCVEGGLYAQNIGTDGTMGQIEPIIPVLPCLAPENFTGQYVYHMEEQWFGTQLSWSSPEITPLHYNLYRTDETTMEQVVIEVDAGSSSFLDQSGMGAYSYQLTAIYDDCESDFALTPTGEDHIAIEVTGIEENTPSRIIKVLSIYNMKGQRVEANDISELPTGIYIIHGLTEDGRLVCEKKIL